MEKVVEMSSLGAEWAFSNLAVPSGAERATYKEVSRLFFEALPLDPKRFANLVRPVLPDCLRNETDELTNEQVLAYERYKAELGEYQAQCALVEIELLEEELFPPANLHAWAQRDLWGLEEFVALSVGAAPEDLEVDLILTQRNSLPLAYDFAHRLSLSRLAVEAGLLKNRDSPARFLHWAKRKNFDLPYELEMLASQYHSRLKDGIPESDAVSHMNAPAKQRMRKKKSITPRDETKDLVIAGMALALGFELTRRNNSAVGKIQQHIEKAGQRLDDQTILNVIRRACEMIRPGFDK